MPIDLLIMGFWQRLCNSTFCGTF